MYANYVCALCYDTQFDVSNEFDTFKRSEIAESKINSESGGKNCSYNNNNNIPRIHNNFIYYYDYEYIIAIALILFPIR